VSLAEEGTTMHVIVEREGTTLRVGMNRPEKKNAITRAMYQALADALHAADADPAVRAVVLHGAPGAFTAGNDLQDFLAPLPGGAPSPAFQFLEALVAARKPLVAAVDGAAIGIGTTMLLHCDFVYASEKARFALPFVNLGLCPEAASSFLLPLTAGYQRAAKLLLLGEPFRSDEALKAGIVTEIVEASVLLETAMATARQLGERPPGAVRTTKQLLKAQQRPAISAAMAEERAAFGRLLGEPAAREAMTAFLEKRKPDFSRFD
jgi:enoyl-CoA hydratase/carnithine racemase